MFGLIKKLISGIIGFITGLLPGKKSGGYYLELKDEEPAKTPAPAPAPTQVTKAEPAKTPAPITKPAPAAKKTATSEPTPAPTETGFATKYLIPASSTSSRRRPGANMNSFLDMAKDMKTAS